MTAFLPALRLPARSKPTGYGYALQGNTEVVELYGGQLVAPVPYDLAGGLLGGEGAGAAAVGEYEESGSAVGRVGFAAQVVPVDEVVDQLRGRLLGDAEVSREVRSGRPRGADPGEREAVNRPDVVEATAVQSLLNPVDELAGHPQGRHSGRRITVRHDLILT